MRIAGARGGTYTPHCARADPARLARGLADACERRGVVIYERSPATAIAPGRVTCTTGSITAAVVVRATEAFTTRLPGESRRYLPLASHMIATEPLPPGAWDELGWSSCAPIADQHYQFVYAQRTPDGRIAIGGRGLTYRLGGAIRESDEAQPAIHARLEQALRRLFPAAAGATVTHRWGGFFAAPRDWSMSVAYDPSSGLARAGGYSGHGVVAVEPRGADAGRPDHGNRERPHEPALGRPREPALGARAAAVPRGTHDRRGGREHRRGRGPNGSPGAQNRPRAPLAARALDPLAFGPVTEQPGRRSFNLHTTPFQEYDLEGPVQPELSWLPISYDPATGQGCYAMRMQPGAVTIDARPLERRIGGVPASSKATSSHSRRHGVRVAAARQLTRDR